MAAGRSACRFFSNSSRSAYRLRQKHQRHTAQGQGIPQLQRGLLSPQAVPLTAVPPLEPRSYTVQALVLTTAQRRMLPGDAGIVQNRHRRILLRPRIFSQWVRGDTAAAGQAQLGPDLRRVGDPQQGPDGPAPESAPTSTGNSSRAMAVYQPAISGWALSQQGQCRTTVPASHSAPFRNTTASDRYRRSLSPSAGNQGYYSIFIRRTVSLYSPCRRKNTVFSFFFTVIFSLLTVC